MLVFFIFVVEDIDEKKCIEQDYFEFQEIFCFIISLLFDWMVVSVVSFDLIILVYINEGYQCIWGCSVKEFYENLRSFIGYIYVVDRL